MQTISLPVVFLDNMVGFTEVASLTTKRALDEVNVHRQSQEKAASLREPLLNYMLEAGVITARTKQAAMAMLGSHAETMNLLKTAIDKIVELKGSIGKQAADGGVGVDPASIGLAGNNGHKIAGEYNSLEDPQVGRHTSLVKESDRPLMALIRR